MALHLLSLFPNSSSPQRTQTFVKSRVVSPVLSVRLLSRWNSMQVLGVMGFGHLWYSMTECPPLQSSKLLPRSGGNRSWQPVPSRNWMTTRMGCKCNCPLRVPHPNLTSLALDASGSQSGLRFIVLLSQPLEPCSGR